MARGAHARIRAQQLAKIEVADDYANIRLFAIRDARDKHVYDAVLHVDNGLVFRAGTTRIAAHLARGGAECRNEALADALDAADDALPRTRRTRRKLAGRFRLDSSRCATYLTNR